MERSIIVRTDYFKAQYSRNEEYKIEYLEIIREEEAKDYQVDPGCSMNLLDTVIMREGYTRPKVSEPEIQWGSSTNERNARMMVDILEDAIKFCQKLEPIIELWNSGEPIF